MDFGNVEVSLAPIDVEREIKEVRILEIKPQQTKYGLRYIARVKDIRGEKWILWLGEKEIQLVKKFLIQVKKRDEEGLILELGTEGYTTKENISKLKIVIKNIRVSKE